MQQPQFANSINKKIKASRNSEVPFSMQFFYINNSNWRKKSNEWRNIMLKAVLTKLVECMELHNMYVLSSAPTVAIDYINKCNLLVECLKDAGYEAEFKMEPVEVKGGEFVGCKSNVFTCLAIYMPTDGSFVRTCKTDEEFKAIGFEQMIINGMYHKFELNRKEEKAV
jgi:hypothetical protein